LKRSEKQLGKEDEEEDGERKKVRRWREKKNREGKEVD
jgi:hypothetical protein